MKYEEFMKLIIKRMDHLYLTRYDENIPETDLFKDHCEVNAEFSTKPRCTNCFHFVIDI